MSAGTGARSKLVCERFGAVSVLMALELKDGCLNYVPRGWKFLGLPMPRFLTPAGKTCEYVEDGKFQFHVEITLPMIGNVVTYEGWLIRD